MIITSIRKIAIAGGLFVALGCGLFFNQAFATDALAEGAFKYQQKMANLGYAEAQYTLATMYEDGIGTKKNLDKALEWYRKAAEQGHELALQKIDAVVEKQRQRSQQGESKPPQQVEKKREEQQEAERKRQQEEEQKRSQERTARENERKQLDMERKRLEQERLQLEADKARLEKARAEQERRAIEKAERELARKRAQEAMRKMMAVPDAMEEE